MLYDSYLPYVLTIIRRFGVIDQNIPDVIQDIFVEVFHNIKKYDFKKGAFKYWLKSIVINKVLNYLRRVKKKKEAESSFINESSTTVNLNLNSIDKEFLHRLIRELPDGYRAVFNLYIIDGYSHKEISQQLGIDPGSSRSQLSRAKRLLKNKILTIQKANPYGLV